MSTVQEITAPAPFSRFAGSARAFVQQVSYDTSTRGQGRARGDHALIARLHDLLGEDGPLSSLTADQAEDAVDDWERGEEWRLTGDESEPILERLDRHFAQPQDAWVAMRERQVEDRARLARQEAERRLNQLRSWIGLNRQRVAEGQALIASLEADLAAAAAELGVQAWP